LGELIPWSSDRKRAPGNQQYFQGRDKLRRSLKISIMMLLALCALTVKAQEKLPLELIATTPMPSFTGDFDHFGLDLKG
jgi:hypothetical protein